MVGIISPMNIFEFRDESELATSLNIFGNEKGCTYLYICDKGDKLKAKVNKDGIFEFMPDIREDVVYNIYGTNMNINIDRNETIPVEDWQFGPVGFKFIMQRVPKPIEL